jgi:drug/metabolite transporter (DMT)-like permease
MIADRLHRQLKVKCRMRGGSCLRPNHAVGIVYGLLAAVLWGGGDVLINRLTQFIGTSKALVGTQLLSLIFWIVYAGVGGFPGKTGVQVWELATICGFFHVAGLILTYRAFEIGTLSLVSPIASSFAIVTALLAVSTGEHPGGTALAGAFLLVGGVVVVTRASSTGGNATLKGVPEALGSAVGFGVMFWMFDRAAHDLGSVAWPLVVLKVMASSSAVAAALGARRKAKLAAEPDNAAELAQAYSRKEVWLLALGVALSDSLAWVCWILGEKTSFTSVVTALASLFSVVTVVLAALLLKERLNRPQWIGIVTIFIGILLVSVQQKT